MPVLLNTRVILKLLTVRDVRDLSLDDSEVQENVQSWAQVVKQDAQLGRVPKPSGASSAAQTDVLNPAMAMLSLNDAMDVRGALRYRIDAQSNLG